MSSSGSGVWCEIPGGSPLECSCSGSVGMLVEGSIKESGIGPAEEPGIVPVTGAGGPSASPVKGLSIGSGKTAEAEDSSGGSEVPGGPGGVGRGAADRSSPGSAGRCRNPGGSPRECSRCLAAGDRLLENRGPVDADLAFPSRLDCHVHLTSSSSFFLVLSLLLILYSSINNIAFLHCFSLHLPTGPIIIHCTVSIRPLPWLSLGTSRFRQYS